MRLCNIRERIKALALFAAKTSSILAVSLIAMTFPFSCTMDDGEVKIIKSDYPSPKLQSITVTDAYNVAVAFSKSVDPVLAYFEYEDSEHQNATQFKGTEEDNTGDILTATSPRILEIGKTYRMLGKVQDGGGNTLTFSASVMGFNSNPANVVIQAVHPKSQKDGSTYKDEFIQLYVTKSGNLSGFTLQSGKMEDKRLTLPAAYVNKGEIVTVHLQALETGCEDECGGNTALASSRYSSMARDVWAYCVNYEAQTDEAAWVKNSSGTNCLSDTDDVVLLSNGNQVLDAMMYATADTEGWKNSTSYDLAQMAAESGQWSGSEVTDAVIIDKAMTAAWILKRTGHLEGGAQTRDDWVKSDFSKKVEKTVLVTLGADGVTAPPNESSSDAPDDGDGDSGSGSIPTSRPVVSVPPPSCEGTAPRVIITSVHPKYEKDSNNGSYKDEFIQLRALNGGNLSHLTVSTGKLGANNFYPLPACEVKTDDIITVHLRRVGDGCHDEVNAKKDEATSRYSCRSVWDVWIDNDYSNGKKGAPALDAMSDTVAVYCGREKTIMDGVFYAVAGTTNWSSKDESIIAENIAASRLWAGDSPSSGIILDKAITAARILKRTGHMQGCTQSVSDWEIADFNKKVEQRVLSWGEIDDSGDTDSSSTSGGSLVGGGSSSGTDSGSSDGNSSTGRRPAVSLPAPECVGIAPRVIICAVHPAYTSATDSDGDKVYKTEFIQLYALTDGNLSHLTISSGKLGSANFYPLPAAPVKAGDIITVHMRRIDAPMSGCYNETDPKKIYVATSWYSCDTVRDVWVENVYNPFTKKGAPALDRSADVVAVYCGREKNMMDAVFYSVMGTADWKSQDAKDIAIAAVSAGIWPVASPSAGIRIDKAFTPATILQRNGCRNLLRAQNNGKAPHIIPGSTDWKKKPFSKAFEQDLLPFVD